MSHSFGRVFKLHTFGESHGPAVGGIVAGCPAGVKLDFDKIQKELNRRRPGSSDLVSERQEADQLEILSGVYQGQTLGTPIGFFVRNQDARSKDYADPSLRHRQGHASELWQQKYGHHDPRGSGRASGRETLSRVVGGAIAQQFLDQWFDHLSGQWPDHRRDLRPDPSSLSSSKTSIKVLSFVQKIGPFELSETDRDLLLDQVYAAKSCQMLKELIDSYSARFPGVRHQEVAEFLVGLKVKGESVGGVVETWILGCPPGLGEPVFDKLKARLAAAVLSIGAFSSFELGQLNSEALGSAFHQRKASYGGIQGGISNGEMIQFRAFVKPTSSILDVAKKGRHDPAVLIRAVPVVDAMVLMALADFLLLNRLSRL